MTGLAAIRLRMARWRAMVRSPSLPVRRCRSSFSVRVLRSAFASVTNRRIDDGAAVKRANGVPEAARELPAVSAAA
jgi:hypothetical protein